MLKKAILCLAVAAANILQASGTESIEYGHLSYDIIYDGDYHPQATVLRPTEDIGNSLTIPDYIIYDGQECPVTAIEDNAFYHCRFTSITLGSNLKWIGSDAFHSSSVSRLVLPASLTNIYGDGLPSVEELIIEDGDLSLNFAAAPRNVRTLYLGRNVFYGKSQGLFPGVSSLTFGEGVTILDDYIFSGATNLTLVKLPSKLEKIGLNAFGNTSITSIEIPPSVTLIEKWAFADSKLNVVRFNSLENAENLIIRGGAFYNVSLASIYINRTIQQQMTIDAGKMLDSSHASLQNVKFGPFAKSIDSEFFMDCYNIKDIVLSEGIESIGSYAFYNCKSLSSITLSNALKSIGTYAFMDCSALKCVILPENLVSIFYHAFEGCSSLSSINIPDKIEQIDMGTFRGCSSLEDVTFGSGIKRIEDEAFVNCTSLKTVILPEGVARLGLDCFKGCSKLARVEFPASLTTFFGAGQFGECTSLESVVCHGSVPAAPSYGTQGLPFDTQTYSTATLWVPDGAAEAYKTAKAWAPFYKISGVDEIAVNGSEISIENGCIVSLSGNDFNIDIHTAGGMLIYSGKVSASPILPQGMYIIKSTTAKKYMVR